MSKVVLCLHCGNKTKMDSINKYVHREEFEELWDEVTYNMYLCPVCKGVSIESRSVFSEDVYDVAHVDLNPIELEREMEKITNTTQLYPHHSIEDNFIPKKILRSYEAAIRVKNIDEAICAIAIRRTLELMCIERGEKKDTKDTLFSMLKSLSEKGVLPPLLENMASVLRKISNAAAHGDEDKFDPTLIPAMIEFTKIILDYVYSLPKRIEEIQASLSEEKEPVGNI